MKITAEPRSDQWNASDFIGSPRTFTIAGVKPGSAEQKYDIELVEGEGRVWRPPLTMLRLLMKVWGTDEAADWAGRRVTLYNDETVRFGKDETGGIRVSHTSHIPKRRTVTLPVSRGRVAQFAVDPLPDAAPTPTPPLADRIDNMIAAYERGGITRTMLEARTARPAADWDEHNVAELTALFESLRAGGVNKADEFPDVGGA